MEKKDYMSPEMEVILVSMKATILDGSPVEQGEDDEEAGAGLFFDNGSNEDW